MWTTSFSPDYFCLTDILATEERVPVAVKSDLAQLGFLDSSSDQTVLEAGTKLELPFWMVWALRSRDRLEIGLPPSWSSGQRKIIQADAGVVDLHKLGPHFYESGRHLMKLVANESDGVGKLLVETFVKRFRGILDTSQNVEECDAVVQTEHLDSLERTLFEQGQLATRATQRWASRRTHHIAASAMIQRHNKRKADVLH